MKITAPFILRCGTAALLAVCGPAAPAGARGEPDGRAESAAIFEGAGPENPETGEQPDGAQPSARELLDEAVARLPPEPLVISGALDVRRRKGIVVQRFAFEMAVHWGGNPVSIRCTIRDTLGNDLEQLTVSRAAGQPPRYSYARGVGIAAKDITLVPEKVPSLYATIRNTDITWADLSFSFLWWRDAQNAGTETVKGYPCYVLDVTPPADDTAGKDSPEMTPYARVRLWIEKKNRMLLKAESYGADNKVIRRLWVKSVKKINERWMVKDIEIESEPVVRRTRLLVEDVRPPEEKNP